MIARVPNSHPALPISRARETSHQTHNLTHRAMRFATGKQPRKETNSMDQGRARQKQLSDVDSDHPNTTSIISECTHLSVPDPLSQRFGDLRKALPSSPKSRECRAGRSSTGTARTHPEKPVRSTPGAAFDSGPTAIPRIT
uniref:Uncharacterized protein n=1 Tax=Knipowitschia caucasica TaxID=637954 RepID=A0AAV2JP74_KNICA